MIKITKRNGKSKSQVTHIHHTNHFIQNHLQLNYR